MMPATEVQDRAESRSSRLGQLELKALFLLECAVRRGQENLRSNDAGGVESSFEIVNLQTADEVTYEVRSTHAFSNEDGELIVSIDAAFQAGYTKSDGIALESDDLDEFAHSVILQVTPFIREFLATMTNRLALTPFYLPLVRAGEVEIKA